MVKIAKTISLSPGAYQFAQDNREWLNISQLTEMAIRRIMVKHGAVKPSTDEVRKAYDEALED